jgi:hypothetical protein
MRIGEDLSSGLEIDYLEMFSAGNLIGNKDLVLIEDELVWRRDSGSKQLCISSSCYSRPVQSFLTDPFRLMLCRISVPASPLSALYKHSTDQLVRNGGRNGGILYHRNECINSED